MQRAETVLGILEQKSTRDPKFVFHRLYRNFFHAGFFLHASNNIDTQPRHGEPEHVAPSANRLGMQQIHQTIAALKNETYRFTPTRRVITDTVVQEMVRGVLQAIYEPLFHSNTHGFRPYRSSHTALHQVERWAHVHHVVGGHIPTIYHGMDHQVLLGLLQEKIADGRFLRLVRDMLQAGMPNDWLYHRTYSGTPVGGILGPILSNIYLHPLDQFVDQVIAPILGEADLQYVRYADQFVLGLPDVPGLCEQVRHQLAGFLKTTLKLTMRWDPSCTVDEGRGYRSVRFLAHELVRSRYNTPDTEEPVVHTPSRALGCLRLHMPSQVVYANLAGLTRGGQAVHRSHWTQRPVADIIRGYAAEIRGLYNYYRMADNVSHQMHKYRYYHRASLLKTIAHKMRISYAQAATRYRVDETIGMTVPQDGVDDLVVRYFDGRLQTNKDSTLADPDDLPHIGVRQ